MARSYFQGGIGSWWPRANVRQRQENSAERVPLQCSSQPRRCSPDERKRSQRSTTTRSTSRPTATPSGSRRATRRWISSSGSAPRSPLTSPLISRSTRRKGRDCAVLDGVPNGRGWERHQCATTPVDREVSSPTEPSRARLLEHSGSTNAGHWRSQSTGFGVEAGHGAHDARALIQKLRANTGCAGGAIPTADHLPLFPWLALAQSARASRCDSLGISVCVNARSNKISATKRVDRRGLSPPLHPLPRTPAFAHLSNGGK